MDHRAGASTAALQHIQLPPIMPNDQLEIRSRDRPLPIEPYAARELFSGPSTSQFIQEGHQSQSSSQYLSTSIGNHLAPMSGVSQLSQEKQKSHETINFMRDDMTALETPRTLHPISVAKPSLPTVGEITSSISTIVSGSLATAASQMSGNVIIAVPPPTGASITPGRPYPPILPCTDNHSHNGATFIQAVQNPVKKVSKSSPSKSSKTRRRWTESETRDLLLGCSIHGVGSWKKVLEDPRFNFNNRSSVDLKDRFRTCFPKEYTRHCNVPGSRDSKDEGIISEPKNGISAILIEEGREESANASGSGRASSKPPSEDIAERMGFEQNFPKAPRRGRKPFTSEEDEALLAGYYQHGPSWSKIQNDSKFSFVGRKSTDLRDRFRNAFPELYASAGFKGKKTRRKPPRSGPILDDDSPEPVDLTGNNSLPPLELHSHYDNSSDVPSLEDFGISPSRLDDHDDRGRKEDSMFNMQDFLGTGAVRDWVNADGLNGAGSSLFSPCSDGHVATPPSGADSSLSDDFSADTLAHFDQQELFSSPVGNDKSDLHDVVRWEDMVTHPLFALETPASQEGTSISIGPEDSVTLAPINPTLFDHNVGLGSLTPSSTSSATPAVPGLSALLGSLNGITSGSTTGTDSSMASSSNCLSVSSLLEKSTNEMLRKRKGELKELEEFNSLINDVTEDESECRQRKSVKKEA